MKIIAFYSFKGGVGRTSALLNVAYLLARRGGHVALADWDVHAPGLTCLYDLQSPEGPRLRPGVIDLLGALAEATPGDDIVDPADLLHPTRLGRRIAESGGGDIWLVPAGAFDPADDTSDYLAAIERIQPRLHGLAASGKGDLVKWFGERVEAGFKDRAQKTLDYLLLDARTGLTEVGDLLLSDATEQVVVLFGLNAQNQIGMEQTLRRLTQSYGPANVAGRVLLVASPVPAGEEALKSQRLAGARATIDRIIEDLSRKASAGDANPIVPVSPRLLTIPYHPLLALDEQLLAEHYPESDPAVVYARIEEILRVRGEGAVQETKSTIARALERAQEKVEPLPRGVPRGEHPFARLLPWNIALPDASEDRLAASAGSLARPLLEGLANSISLSPEERGRILDSFPKLSLAQFQELIRIFGEEQRTFRELAPSNWAQTAELVGRYWAEWALLSASRLGVEAAEAASRLLVGWPRRLDGETGTHAALAAIDALQSSGALTAETARLFVRRLAEANPRFDLALGAAAAILVDVTSDTEEARALFARAAGLEPCSASFGVAFRIGETAKRLLDKRSHDALWLLDEVGRHYQRAVILEPDNHRAENNWALALANQAKSVAEKDLARAELLWAEAVKHYERAIAIKSDSHEAEHNWGLALDHQAGRVAEKDLARAELLWAEAAKHYERALATKPDKHEAENNWGLALEHQAGRVAEKDLARAELLWAEAAKHYERALAIKPDLHEAENNWGSALDYQARRVAEKDLTRAEQLWAEAVKHYERALVIKPDKHEAEYNWGNALANQAKRAAENDRPRAEQIWAEAGKHYEHALALKPEDHETKYNLVGVESARHHALRRAGRDEEAHAAAEYALTLAEQHQSLTGKPSYNLACALCINGRIEEALDVLERLHETGALDVGAKHLESDPDLTAVAQHPRFLALLATLRAPTA